ncbi:MAG: 50S ribosomal protein L10 [Candidatus Hodarchaeota archaeon]
MLNKEEQITHLQRLIEEHNVIGLFSLNNITSSVIQQIRRNLRGQTELKIAKNTLKTRAIDEVMSSKSKPSLDSLKDYIKGSCGLIFSNMNPFKLQRFLHQNRRPAPARTGQIVPVDVIVPEGNTNLDPGPVIGELNSIGLPTRIEKGKIKIIKSTRILKVGDTVTETHASVLARLGILPFESGLEMLVAYENGVIFEKSDLNIDITNLLSQLKEAGQNAMSLALEIDYICEQTILSLLQKVHQHTVNLALEIDYISNDTLKPLLSKGYSHAISLANMLKGKDPNAAPSNI